MKQLIVIPTFNEKTNISYLLKKLIRLYKSKFEILVIDDNSPDGTAAEVLKFSKKYKFIKLKSRKTKWVLDLLISTVLNMHLKIILKF